jgi:hypothetical protein
MASRPQRGPPAPRHGSRPTPRAATATKSRTRAWSQLRGDLVGGLAFGSQFLRAAQLAHDVLRGMPLPTSHLFIVPFGPTSGHRTLKQWVQISWIHLPGICHTHLGLAKRVARHIELWPKRFRRSPGCGATEQAQFAGRRWRVPVEHVAKGGGEVEIAFAGVGGAALGAKRNENHRGVVAAGGLSDDEAAGVGDGV